MSIPLRLLAPFTAALLVAGPIAAQAPAFTADRLQMQDDVVRLIGGTGGRSAEWGVLAISLEHGDTLASVASDLPLAPASNQKLFTSAATLHHLGPDFRFPTFLLTDGSVRGDVLDGNLILYGTGDPAISGRFFSGPTEPFREFARVLLDLGIRAVSGEVIGDGSFFEGPARHASWNPRDLDNWFAAPVSALSFNENVVTIQVRGGAPGTPPVIRTNPEGAGLLIANSAISVSGGPSPSLVLVRSDPDGAIELRGQVRTGSAEIWRVLTVSDPASYAASVLRHVLEEEGIRVLGAARSLGHDEVSALSEARTVAPGFAASATSPRARTVQTLAMHRSPPVRELLHVMNKASHNLYSELFLFTVGRITTGAGSFATGSQALTDYLVRVVGVDADGLHVEDGSGLSRFNRATASSLVQLMAHVSATGHADEFWASLPEAGNRMELGRMYRTPAAGNLRAKTGTISRVSALSGVVRGLDGEPILFSILANNVPSTSSAKGVEDRIGIQLASFARNQTPMQETLARVEFGDHGPRLGGTLVDGTEAARR